MREQAARMAELARRELTERILPFWLTNDFDPEGGFYGEVDADGAPVREAERCLILNARILWTFSNAYRVLGEKTYQKAAEHAYVYFRDHFIDPEYGGAYYMLRADGTPSMDFKFVYGEAFAIYGLSEYYRATGCEEALALAVSIFDCLEKYAYDPVNKGYFEAFTRDWRPYEKLADRPHSCTANTEKSMNTHLHMIEGYTSLLRVWRGERLVRSVRDQLLVMTRRIVDPATGHFFMYQHRDWTNVGLCQSFGHDIEGSWLMTETLDVLGDASLREEVLAAVGHMARACLEESVAPDGSMLDEYDPETGRLSAKRIWWVEAEEVVGFLNAYQLSGEARYLDASEKALDYILRYFGDSTGEWYAVLNELGRPVNPRAALANGWKCPYHNGRMCMEILERCEAL